MKKILNLFLLTVFLYGCNAQIPKISSEQQMTLVSNKLCNCFEEKIRSNTDWKDALFECDNEILYSKDKDFFKLEYTLKEEYPDKNMSTLVWNYKSKVLRNTLINCNILKPLVDSSKVDTLLKVYKNLTFNKQNYFGESYFSTRNLFSKMLRTISNDSIKVLFETTEKYNEKLKDIQFLNETIAKIKKCKFYNTEKEIKNGFVVFIITPYVGEKAISQYKLFFKEKDVVYRIVDFELIDKSKIKFDSSVLGDTPPPPPPPVPASGE